MTAGPQGLRFLRREAADRPPAGTARRRDRPTLAKTVDTGDPLTIAATSAPSASSVPPIQPAATGSGSVTETGSVSSSGSVHVQAAPWRLPTAPWRAASTRSGSPKIPMNPTAAAWSNASPWSYVARSLSYSESGERRPATTADPWSSRTRTSPRDDPLGRRDVAAQVAVEGAEPQPVVGQLGQLVRDEPVEPERVLRERQPLERAVRRVEDRRRRRLVDLAALDPDEAVLDVVDPADAVVAAEVVQPVDELDRGEPLAVDRDRDAALELDRDLDRRRRRRRPRPSTRRRRPAA